MDPAHDYRRLNLDMWDERAPIHERSAFYDVDAFRAGRCALRAFEYDELGDVAGRSLLHLQCHIGLDTLSWARRGAVVTGLDFSAEATRIASRLAADLGIDADFVTADVYDAVRAVDGRRFDIVYTGIGALCWIPDLTRWAEVVAASLRPDGRLYLVEFHPFADMLDDAEARTVSGDYFAAEPIVYEAPGSYADAESVTRHNTSVEFRHTLADVVTSLARAGLRLEFLHEHPFTMFQRFECLRRRSDDGLFEFPADRPRCPLLYTVRARI